MTKIDDPSRAEIDRLRAENQKLTDHLSDVVDNAVDMLGNDLCERHSNEVKNMPFSDYLQRIRDMGCPWCAKAEAERLRSGLMEIADSGCGRWNCHEKTTCRDRHPNTPDVWCWCCRARGILAEKEV